MAPETPTPTEILTSKFQWPTSGRRALRKELEATHKIHTRDTHDTSRLVKIAPRKNRRQPGKNRRPVYYHGVPVELEHKAVIAALKVHPKGRRQAMIWLHQVRTAKACVHFGKAVKSFLADCAERDMDIRHSTLKATGKWVNHGKNR